MSVHMVVNLPVPCFRRSTRWTRSSAMASGSNPPSGSDFRFVLLDHHISSGIHAGCIYLADSVSCVSLACSSATIGFQAASIAARTTLISAALQSAACDISLNDNFVCAREC